MAACEARAWSSWHHHMALVAVAHLFVTLTARDMKRNEPKLTLEMALTLLRSTFARNSSAKRTRRSCLIIILGGTTSRTTHIAEHGLPNTRS